MKRFNSYEKMIITLDERVMVNYQVSLLDYNNKHVTRIRMQHMTRIRIQHVTRIRIQHVTRIEIEHLMRIQLLHVDKIDGCTGGRQ